MYSLFFLNGIFQTANFLFRYAWVIVKLSRKKDAYEKTRSLTRIAQHPQCSHGDVYKRQGHEWMIQQHIRATETHHFFDLITLLFSITMHLTAAAKCLSFHERAMLDTLTGIGI